MTVIGELLFYSGFGRWSDLADQLRATQESGMRTAVDRLSASDFGNFSDVELVTGVVEKCVVAPLSLDLAGATGDVTETSLQRQNLWGETDTVKGLKVTKVIPFEGEAVLFELQPSSSNLNPPRGIVRGKTVIVGMEVAEYETDAAVRYIDEMVASLQQYIGWQSDAIAQHNASLPALACALIAERRARLSRASDLASRLGGG